MTRPPVRRQGADWRWEGVDSLRYKAEGTAPFRDVTRQNLFQDPASACDLRYFEVQPNGYTTLERHEHAHAVMILRGRGRVLVADRIFDVAAHDLVRIHPLAWHQFRAGAEEAFGFLCMVNAERDRPQLPSEDDLSILRRDPAVAAFIAL
jgi:quercetin dioxygenase-like cupin family protein